jgi:hypothetical protein
VLEILKVNGFINGQVDRLSDRCGLAAQIVSIQDNSSTLGRKECEALGSSSNGRNKASIEANRNAQKGGITCRIGI